MLPVLRIYVAEISRHLTETEDDGSSNMVQV